MEILYAGAKLLSSPESRQETASPISHEKEREREKEIPGDPGARD